MKKDLIDEIVEKYNLIEGRGYKPIMYLVIKELKQRIKSAYEFYLRYKDKPELLIKEHPEYKKKVNIFEPTKIYILGHKVKRNEFYDLNKFNEWLFKLAFKDVIENISKKKTTDQLVQEVRSKKWKEALKSANGDKLLALKIWSK